MYKTQNGWTKEKMIEHIKKEFKGKSHYRDTCFYRGPHGKKCAMGMFIPDSEYKSSMETIGQNSATAILRDYPQLNKYMPLELNGMIVFQTVHDRSISNEECLFEMLQFVKTFVKDSHE